MALKKPTWQSSTATASTPGLSFSSDKAVDGDNSTELLKSTCSSTAGNTATPWLAVDLGTVALIRWIQLTDKGGTSGNDVL
jgi:hypothetical protein